MKHNRRDYDRIQDTLPESQGGIPADEPVFLLRASDLCAAKIVLLWADLAERRGAAPEMVASARSQARAMDEWPKKKIPDAPNDGPDSAA